MIIHTKTQKHRNTKTPLTPRLPIAALPPATHGDRDHIELAARNLTAADLIDFSTNSNPYGPPPQIVQAIQAAVKASMLGPYPDRACLALTQAISAAENTPANHILSGNGTAELIQNIALAYVRPKSTHLLLAPTFGEYRRAIQLLDGQIYEHWPSNDHLLHDSADLLAAIQHVQPDTIWLCNPNNPTGQQWTSDQLAALQTATPDALWVIDEAYLHFLEHPTTAWQAQPNQIILRSLTKDFTLAGLRLGYLLAVPQIIETLRQVQVPWSVNTFAQIAGEVAHQPECLTWRTETLTQLRRDAHQLWHELRRFGLTVHTTKTTFALIDISNSPHRTAQKYKNTKTQKRLTNAANFRSRLLDHRILVRDCASFGLPNHIRVAAQRPEDNQHLIDVIRKLLRAS